MDRKETSARTKASEEHLKAALDLDAQILHTEAEMRFDVEHDLGVSQGRSLTPKWAAFYLVSL